MSNKITLLPRDKSKFMDLIKQNFRSILENRMQTTQTEDRQVVYASMETLPGSVMANTLMNLLKSHPIRDLMRKAGITHSDLSDADVDPALGNGGLGRLNACIQEACASQNIPFTVSTLRYRRGLFRQKLENGQQVAVSDDWLDSNGEFFFEFPDPAKAQWVCFREGGQHVWVELIPCAIPQIGANDGCSITLAWKVGRILASHGINRDTYRCIDEYLYDKNRDTRLRQEYCVSSATVQNLLADFGRKKLPLTQIPEHYCLHINDTHAALMIPELLRILLDDYIGRRDGAWDTCWDIVTKLFVYTNHTVLPEALEEWEIDRMNGILPRRTMDMIREIDRRFREQLDVMPIPLPREAKEKMYIIHSGKVRMANLCICAARSVNGVAKLHTQILCQRLLEPFHRCMADKFCNVTNGIGFRKFLAYANPDLADLIGAYQMRTDWINHPEDMINLLPHVDDLKLQADFTAVHARRKAELAAFIRRQRGIDIPEDFLYQVQVKRFHMYKRQLLGCLYILWLCCRIREDKDFDMVPTAFIFGGKAADDYFDAKEVIRLILALEKFVNGDPLYSSKLRVAMVEDFNVSKAMPIYPAADVSVQISTAGKEASGTGNMKFMVNGGLTLGTLDGANVEIHEAVGDEGMFLFGLKDHEINAMKDSYRARDLYQADGQLREVIDMLTSGILDTTFPALVHELLTGRNGKAADEFFVLADFRSFVEANRRVWDLYRRPESWTKQCLRNIALSGEFSSDRMVREYNSKIWNTSRKNG